MSRSLGSPNFRSRNGRFRTTKAGLGSISMVFVGRPSMWCLGATSIVLASCAAPQTQQQSKAMATQALALESAAEPNEPMPHFPVGSDPTPDAVNQINDFLLAEQAELARHRAEQAQDSGVSSSVTEDMSVTSSKPVSEVVPDTPEATVDAPASAPSAIVATESVVTEETTGRSVDALTPWIRSLMDGAAQSDAPVRQHLALAIVLALSAPEQSFDPAGLTALTDDEQELLRIVYERFALLREELDSGADASDSLQIAFEELLTSVQAEEPFQVSRMELCSWVRDFGDVDVIEPPTFAPKERPRFIWYVELEGVEPFEETEAGSWLYEFAVRLEVLTRDTGIPVIAPIEGTVRHAASSRVRDLFLRDIFEMPADLQFDWYTVKLTVTDRRSGAQAQKGTDVLWVPNLAAGAALLDRQAAVDTQE